MRWHARVELVLLVLLLLSVRAGDARWEAGCGTESAIVTAVVRQA